MDQEVEYAIVIDEKSDELERLMKLFHPDIFVIKKFQYENEVVYHVEGEMEEVNISFEKNKKMKTPMRRRPEMDTIVCPAREEGFNQVFLNENRWFPVRINPKRIPQIKFIAIYERKPKSAIRYVGEIDEIIPYKNTGMYEIVLKGAATKIKRPIKLSKQNPNLAPQSSRYTIRSLIDTASTLEDIFE